MKELINQTNIVSDKHFMLAQTLINTALSVIDFVKMLPKTGKHKRNIFIKTYNRRPMNKKKRAVIMAQIAMATATGAINVAITMQHPLPKQKLSILQKPITNERICAGGYTDKKIH